MKHYDFANIPGDGVGQEIAREAVKVMDAAATKFGFKISYENFDWGCDYFLKHGEMNPSNMLETLKGSDAIFLGCIGDASKVPDHVSLGLLLGIRKGFDQYVNLRPIQLYPGVHSPISTATPETVDMIVVRENTEGEYSSMGGREVASLASRFFQSGEHSVSLDAGKLKHGVYLVAMKAGSVSLTRKVVLK